MTYVVPLANALYSPATAIEVSSFIQYGCRGFEASSHLSKLVTNQRRAVTYCWNLHDYTLESHSTQHARRCKPSRVLLVGSIPSKRSTITRLFVLCTAMSVPVASTEKAWHEAYPPPQCQNPASISATELLHALQKGGKPGVDFILVDLRRNDHEVGSPHARHSVKTELQ